MLADLALHAALFGTGAALALPASRRLLLGDPEGDFLADELDFDFLHGDGRTVQLKSGDCFRIWRMKGLSYETKTLNHQESLMEQRARLMHELAGAGVTLRFFGIKRSHDVSFACDWPSITLQEIGDAEQKAYQHSYDVRWYLVIQSNSFNKLDKATQKARIGLSDYGATPIKASLEHAKTCPVTGFLNYLISGELIDSLPVRSQALSGSLPGCDFAYDADGNLTTYSPLKHHSRIIAVRDWPSSISGMVASEILALKGDVEFCTICIPHSRNKVVVKLKHKQQQLEAAWIGNEEYAAQHKFIAEEINNDKEALWQTQTQITLRAPSIETLDKLVTQVSEILTKRRVIHSQETNGPSEAKGAVACWFNRLPGRDKLYRPLELTNRNLAALWPFQYSPTGLEASHLCKHPVRRFPTPSGGSYAFQFQCSDQPQSLGNTLIFAPPGSGKTTLVLHLLAGLSKVPGFKNFVFDSQEGAKYLIEAFGGHYMNFENLAFNPLDVANDDKRSRQSVVKTMKAMLGDAYDESMDDEITHVLDIAFKLPLEHRTFSKIYDTAFTVNSPTKKAFGRWVEDNKGRRGEHADLFNAPMDKIASALNQSFLTGINMNEALGDPVLAGPAVSHISQGIIRLARETQAGFSIFIDEGANLLQNPGFRMEFANVLSREVRKLDGILVTAFQDAQALFNLPDYEAIFETTATYIFFPNPATKPEALAKFNLNEEQIAFVMGQSSLSGDRQVLIVKRDASRHFEESAIVSIDLSPLGDSLRFFRSGPDANRHIDALKARWGDEWLAHL